jgi:hypothetical protein
MQDIGIIEVFDGKNRGVSQFLADVEEAGIFYGWSDLNKISVAKLRLSGRAQIYVRSSLEFKDISWSNFCEILINRYGRKENLYFNLKRLFNYVQNKDETIEEYATNLRYTGEDLIQSSEFKNEIITFRKIVEYLITVQFTLGIDNYIGSIVASHEPKNLDHAVRIAVLVRNVTTLKLRDKCFENSKDNILKDTVEVHNLKQKCSNGGRMKDYFKKTKSRSFEGVCSYCNKYGHKRRYCRLAITCNYCLQKGHSVGKCFLLRNQQKR